MKVSIFAVSSGGITAAGRIKEAIEKSPDTVTAVYIKSNQTGDQPADVFIIPKNEEMGEYVGKAFLESDALVFACAAGIAVRMIAPYIKHKSEDPAVLVIDEAMSFCIPILSGHLGGANKLAKDLSEMLNMTPVITTASDIAGHTAVDMFAKARGLLITDFEKAKDFTSALLAGETLYVVNEAEDVFKPGELPGGYKCILKAEVSEGRMIRIAYRTDGKDDIKDELLLIPKCIKLGIGCRRGTAADKIREAVEECLKSNGIYTEAVQGIYSIDLKKNEKGLKEYSRELKVPFVTYSAEELGQLKGDFSSSRFVDEVTGVDNVCERSAMMTGKRLIVHKKIYDGVTVAVSV